MSGSYAEQAEAAGFTIDDGEHVSVTFVGPKGAAAARGGKAKPKREPQKPKPPKPRKPKK